jgi:hypothetical protein
VSITLMRSPARSVASQSPDTGIRGMPGTFTWERLVQTTLVNIIAVGIKGIRRYYSTFLPAADHFFRRPTDRTAVNELLDIGARSSWRGLVFATSSAILTVNSIVGGARVALGLHEAGLVRPASIVVGVLLGLLLLVAVSAYHVRQFKLVKSAVAAAA